MKWAVEAEIEFERWWETLSEAEQISVDAHIRVLEAKGPMLGRPYVDSIQGSRHQNMKELRVQHGGRPLRVLFAFDPRRVAILLLGGDKTGNARWYRVNVPKADAIFDRHLATLASDESKQRR